VAAIKRGLYADAVAALEEPAPAPDDPPGARQSAK
jgi:hypothetical protein